ncbi:MAG: hypothetical protein WDZ72_05285 [Cyclobacteriaceae bacterium]
MENLQILSDESLSSYMEQVSKGLPRAFAHLHDAEISTDSFSFYTSVSSVFSSKIEGEDIELDSYIKHKRFGIEFLRDYTKKIDDLYNAYSFAKNHELNQKNLLEAHQLLIKHLLPKDKQGSF